MTAAMPFLFSRIARYGGIALLVLFAVVYFVRLPLRPAGAVMTDFSAYYAAGRYWSHGGDPYSRGLWDVERTLPGVDPKRAELLPFVGPPLSLPLWAALGALPYPVAAALWGVVLVLSAGTVLVLPRLLCRRPVGGAGAVSLALFGLACAPIVVGISVGQAALPAAAAAEIAIVCAVYRRWLPMAAALLVAALLKPNDALVVLGAVRDLMTLGVVVLAAGLAAAANIPFAGGPAGLIRYLDVIVHQTASERFFVYQMTPTSIVYGFGLQPQGAIAFGTAVSVIAVAITVAAIVRTRASPLARGAIVCALFPFYVPFEHEPDVLIALLPALLVVFTARGWNWAIGATGATLLCVDAFAMAQGSIGVAFTALTAVVAALQLAALAPPEMRRLRSVPMIVVPLVIAIGIFAPPARLPLWPDGMPQHVAVAPNASVTTAWHDELAAAGLEERRPWTSLLRTLTLAGCALIAFATIRQAALADVRREPERRAALIQPLFVE